MALQHKSGSQAAVNWISCTDDSKTEQNKYQNKWGKKSGLVLKYIVRAFFLMHTLHEGKSITFLLLTYTLSNHFKWQSYLNTLGQLKCPIVSNYLKIKPMLSVYQ